jgi:hypothetical protein
MPDGRQNYETLNVDLFRGLYAFAHPTKETFPLSGSPLLYNFTTEDGSLTVRKGRRRLNATKFTSAISFLSHYVNRDNAEFLVLGRESTSAVTAAANGVIYSQSSFDPMAPAIEQATSTSLLPAAEGARHSVIPFNGLLYLTDGLTTPKMFDGTSYVNWGIDAPTTPCTQAGVTSGANVVDACEALWTPVSSILSDGETAWSLKTGITNAIPVLSGDAIVGANSALTLLGYSIAPVSSNTILMLHADGVDGATATTDSSSFARTAIFGGSAQLDTAFKVFGTASLLFNHTGANNVHFADSSDYDLGTGDYTLDLRIRQDGYISGSYVIFAIGAGQGAGTAKGLALDSASTTGYRYWHNGSVVATFATASNDGVWRHVRVTRTSGVVRFFQDGNPIAPTGYDAVAAAANLDGSTEGLYVGGYFLGNNFSFQGNLDEIRFDKGVSLSTTDTPFIVPTYAYGSASTPIDDPLGFDGLVAYKDVTPVDLTSYWGVSFWIKTLKTLQASDATLTLCDSAGGQTILESFVLPAMLVDTWTKLTYKFQNPSTLTSVASVGLVLNRDAGQQGYYIDDFKAIRCNISLDTTELTEGNASLKFEIPGKVPAGTLVAYKDFASTNYSSDTVAAMSFRCSKETGHQTFKYVLDNTSACASPLEALYIDDILAADVWHNLNLTLADPSVDTAIVSHGLVVNDPSIGPCNVWLDNIKRATAATGNLTGRYFSWVSFYSTKYDRESDLSPISNVVSLTAQAIALTNIPVSSDPQVDARRIYRSQAGATVPYLEATILDNTTTTKTLSAGDATLAVAFRHPSAQSGSGKYAPPQAMPYALSFKNRILMAGALPYTRGKVTTTTSSATFLFTDGAVVQKGWVGLSLRLTGQTQEYYIQSVDTTANTVVARPISDLNTGLFVGAGSAGNGYEVIGDKNLLMTSYLDSDDVSRVHGFPFDEAQTVEGGKADDRITGLGLTGDAVLIPKRFSTFIAEGSYSPWTITRISDTIGCAAHSTIVQDELGKAIWFAGVQGIVTSAGYSVDPLSMAIADLFNGESTLKLEPSMFSKAHAVYDTKQNFYYLFCASYGSSENDICIVMDRQGSKDPAQWNWYYLKNIYAKASTIVYDDNGTGAIYITDYDGFVYTLNTGYYDGVSSGTLKGTPTSADTNTINMATAAFYTTGSGLLGISLIIENKTTKVWNQYEIASNTGTSIDIVGVFTEDIASAPSNFTFYVAAYPYFWLSKQDAYARPTDKELLLDMVLYHEHALSAPSMRVRMLKNLARSVIADQFVDLTDASEETVLLIRERVAFAQAEISGFVHGAAFTVQNMGVRFRKHGVR